MTDDGKIGAGMERVDVIVAYACWLMFALGILGFLALLIVVSK